MRDWAGKNILVTGAAGFIGSALIAALNRQGAENILAVDLLGRTEKWRLLSELRFADYMEADELWSRLTQGRALPGKWDHIFHLGACSATTETDAAYLIRNNYEYTKALAGHAMAQGSRFVYASSAATYGDGAEGMSDDDFAKLPLYRPLNMYGYSKHLFDLYAWKQGWLSRCVGLKYFNVFGPNEGHKGDMRSVVHKAFEQIQQTGGLKLFKSHRPDYEHGTQKRDFLYVKDAVDITLHLGAADFRDAHGLFNVGSGVPHTWLDLAHAIFEAMDRPVNIEFIDMPESLRAKYQYYTCADIRRLRETGYVKNITPLKEAVTDYVRKYLVPGRHLSAGHWT